MAGVTIFALISFWLTPEEAWLPRQRISHFVESEGVQRESDRTHGGQEKAERDTIVGSK
jgi:hypothetical protein